MSVDAPGADPQLVRANKLDLVERLADDLAHEIKNPLHSMVINLEVLKRRIARAEAGESDELMRYVGVLGSELDRVNRRIEVLLRMVRPDRSAEPTTLEHTVEELLELLELERGRRNVAFRFEPAPAPVRGHLPADLTRQMVLNLILGMLDQVGSGGVLTIRTEADAEWTRLRLEGTAPSAGTGEGGAPEESHLSIGRTLGESLGGRLELSDGADAERTIAATLSLPLPTRKA